VYRARTPSLVLLAVTTILLVTAAAITGFVLAGAAIAALMVIGWLAQALRIARLQPSGPRGDGPAPPGGAGVREPRRPLPVVSTGAAAVSVPTDKPTYRTVAIA
jgi:hypothetical protein